jgi:hypothetical protein
MSKKRLQRNHDCKRSDIKEKGPALSLSPCDAESEDSATHTERKVIKNISRNHDSKDCKIIQKALTPLAYSNTSTAAVGVRTSTKQSMDYVTINGIVQRINYTVDRFPEWILNQLMINAIDFLNNNYYSKPDTRMIVWVNVQQKSEVLRIRVRNSNDFNLNPFPLNLHAIFDLTTFNSTKRHQRGISGGALGDALKEILAMPYALISSTDDGSSFTRKQWEEPLVVRFCGQEYRVYLYVNKADDNNPITSKVDGPYPLDCVGNDTDNFIEFEVFMPLIPAIVSRNTNLIENLRQQYKAFLLARHRRLKLYFTDNNEELPQ